MVWVAIEHYLCTINHDLWSMEQDLLSNMRIHVLIHIHIHIPVHIEIHIHHHVHGGLGRNL